MLDFRMFLPMGYGIHCIALREVLREQRLLFQVLARGEDAAPW